MAKALVKWWDFATITIDPVLGEIMSANLVYNPCVDGSHQDRTILITILPTDTAAIIKKNIQDAIIADAGPIGYTLIATDIIFPDMTRGVVI